MLHPAHSIHNTTSPRNNNNALFSGRRVLVASMHGKEKSLGPVLKKAFGIELIAAQNIDTDCLGTFTGEIERTLSPRENALKKCFMAFENSPEDLSIATEGSFGPHPQLPFLPLHEEWLALVDRKHDVTLCLVERSILTNFNARWVSTKDELDSFLTSIGFPFHGVIASDGPNNRQHIFKGLRNLPDVYKAFHRLKVESEKVYLETDMRAMHNPSRMLVLVQLAKKLATALESYCPQCAKPGFIQSHSEPGLRCAQCGLPGQQPAWHVHSCQQCEYEKKYPVLDQLGDPTYCLICNP